MKDLDRNKSELCLVEESICSYGQSYFTNTAVIQHQHLHF